MPGNNVGVRSFNLPGRNFGGQGIAGEADETMEERVRRRVKMGRICHYCECSFIADKDNQRFHSSRCGMLARAGKIHEETFKRWILGLREVHRWNDGVDIELEPFTVYERPQDACQFDQARRRLYLTILEIQKRAPLSSSADQARAYRILADGLLALFTLPHGVDLSGPYNDDTTELPKHVGELQQADLPGRGFDAWRIVAEAHTERLTRVFNGNPPGDLQWLVM